MNANTNTINLLVLVSYHTLITGAGCIICYLGYKLFRVGIFEKVGDLKAAFGEQYLTLRGGAPGTFFAILGAVIILVSTWRGVKLTTGGVVTAGAAVGAASDGDTSIAGLGGTTPQTEPLSLILRHALSDEALCLNRSNDPQAGSKCVDQLKTKLPNVPVQEDITTIEQLERRPKDAKTADSLHALRLHFLGGRQ
jgi:hypothetical protein